MKLSMILAMSENQVIGHHNTMPWHLSDELKRFKRITTGHAIIMGRKTFESLGRALPHRRNIVLTRRENSPLAQRSDIQVVHNLQDALVRCAHEKEAFIIGGAQIYRQAYPLTDCLYLTRIHAQIQGDTTLDLIDLSDWKLIEREKYTSGPGNNYDFTCDIYCRRHAPGKCETLPWQCEKQQVASHITPPEQASRPIPAS